MKDDFTQQGNGQEHVRRNGYFSITSRAGAIPELDGLRGIAILLVLLRHAVRPIYSEQGELAPILGWDIAYPLLNGWMGVDLFFVLSGFLVSHHLLKRWPARFSFGFLAHYWLKRILRTFPAYFATLALVVSGALVFYENPMPVTTDSLMAHTLFFQDYAFGSFVPAFWSLGVEEKFYLACPFLLLALGRLPLSRQGVMIVVLALCPILFRTLTMAAYPLDDQTYEQFFWSTRAPFHLALDGLVWGVACGIIYHHKPKWFSNNLQLKDTAFRAGLAIVLASFIPIAWFDTGWWRSSILVIAAVSFGFALLVLAILMGETPLSRVLRSRSLRFFSVISYSLYLVHLIVVPLAEDLANKLQGSASHSAAAQLTIFLPIFLLLSILAALVLHYSVEKPFLRLKDRL